MHPVITLFSLLAFLGGGQLTPHNIVFPGDQVARSGSPYIREVRQASRVPICVPAGTCAGPSQPVIDPRIVTGGGQQQSCGPGEVLCQGIAGVERCGIRYENVGGGDGATAFGSHPWQAYITNQTGYTGSGVLLDSRHVLTAAHKVYLNKATPNQLRVYMGVFNPATSLNTAVRRTVTNVDTIDTFNPETLINDIAILTLDQAVPLGYRKDVARACLPAEGTSAQLVGRTCIVAGWGMTSFGANDAPTTPQKQVNVQIVDYNTCFNSMSRPDVLGTNAAKFLNQNEICAGGQANRDACTQDGGAPLTCNNNGQYSAVALVIWGKSCGRQGVYGVYVDIAKYMYWIRPRLV